MTLLRYPYYTGGMKLKLINVGLGQKKGGLQLFLICPADGLEGGGWDE